jgi:hypothetical protein
MSAGATREAVGPQHDSNGSWQQAYARVARMQATACWSGWKAMQALTQVNRYLGVITIGWVPVASLGAASITLVMAMLLWHITDSKSKQGLLAGQVVMQVLCAGCSLLAMLCWLHPSKMDPRVSVLGGKAAAALSCVGLAGVPLDAAHSWPTHAHLKPS